MDNKKKKFNTNRVAAYALSGVMLASVIPYNVFASTSQVNNALEMSDGIKPTQLKAAGDKALTDDQKKRAGQSANNWKEEISQDNDYWQVEKGWQGRNLGGTSSIGMALSEINYLGTYTDANGNDVIRLQWQGDTRSNAGSWMNNLSLALKFQKDLYEKIDWNKSYAYSSYGKEEKFLFNNVKSSDYQAEFTLAQLAKSYTGAKYELPINLVLKDGVKIADLGKKDYLIQHRGLDVQNKLVLTNVPGTQRDVDLNTIEYGQFTRSTIVPLNSNLNNDVIPANSNKKSNEQRFGTSEYDSDKKVIRTRHYYIKSDSIDSYLGNVGFTQSFDARLLDLLKEDEKGNVAYLDVNTIDNEKAYKTTPKVAIKRDQINVKNGVATIYVVGSDFKSNLEETGIKVVRATSGNIKTGIYSTLFKTWTINYVNTSIEYNVDEDMISKLFPQNKYLQSYAFSSGFVHENKDGFLRSDQEVKEDTVIKKGDKLTLEFKDRINNKGNQYVMQIGETYHLMNDDSAPQGASEFETISERNAGKLTNKDMKYDITMQAGRTLHAGDKIKLWIINDNGHKYESQGWRLFINKGDASTDKDIVNVEGENTFVKDYSPYYFQHSKSVDGAMVTKYKYVPQVEEIFDTDTEIKGTVRKDGNNVTGYYIAPTGDKFYFDTKLSADKNSAETIILDENGRKVEKGDEKYDAVYKYALGQLKTEDGKEILKLKKDMPIYINTARKGQFPSDPVIEKVKSRVTFDQNYEGKPDDKVVVAPENDQYLGNAGYKANGLDYNGKNVMPENPTREGYVFKGWATKADAKEANFDKDTPITESLKVYAVWVKEDEAKDADKYTPEYTDADAVVGKQTTITAPNFKDKDGKDTTKPEETTFKLGEGAPEGAKIDENTGKITYTPADGTAGTDVEIPVIVTYPDKTTDEITAKVTVAKADPTEATAKPEITAPKAGDKEIKGKAEPNAKVVVELPDGTKVETTADGEGNFTAKVPEGKEPKEGETVKATATVDGKKPSEEATAKTGKADPTEATAKPEITAPKAGDKEIKGKAEPNAKVVVELPDGTKVETTADGEGNFTAKVPEGKEPKEGQTVKATATVDGKKPSEEATAKTGKADETDAKKNPAQDPKKTEVENKNKLTPDEKNKVKEEVEKANPKASDVTVDDKGNAELTYPDGSKNIIPADKTVTEKGTGSTGGNDGYRPGHSGRDIFDGLFRRHDYTPTYPVKTVVPGKTAVGTQVEDTLWYVFRINEFEYEVVRNGVVTKRKMDVTPVLQNNRTMLPLRYVAEALQADVKWDAKTRTATFTKDGLTASIQIDSDEIVLSNGKTVKMDSKPLNINDRILVSVTNVANVFGLTNGNTKDKADQDIEWEQQDKSATIYIRR